MIEQVFNPFTPKISLVIPLTICHILLIILVLSVGSNGNPVITRQLPETQENKMGLLLNLIGWFAHF